MAVNIPPAVPETYSGPPFTSEIPEWVQGQLNYRAIDRNRPIVPFIKITPGFHVTGGAHPPKKIILKGVAVNEGQESYTLGFDQLYREEAYSRPRPGVKSISVEYKNVTGAVRKGTITWACHTLDDMERLAPYFLNPGRTVLIEWGWSMPEAASELSKNSDDKYTGWALNNYYNILWGGYDYQKNQKIPGKVEKSNGNYDAMLGLIVNFKFDLNRDGGYDCVTEVTSVGDLMTGLTTNQQIAKDPMALPETPKKTLPAQGGSSAPPPAPPTTVPSSLRDLIDSFLYSYLKNDIDAGTRKGRYIIPKDTEKDDVYIVPVYSETDTSNVGLGTSLSATNIPGATTVGNAITSKSIGKTKSGYFVSWGYIEDKIINPFIGLFDSKNNPLMWLDSSTSKIGAHPDMRTLNLDTCIIPALDTNSTTDANFPTFYSTTDTIGGTSYFGSPRKILVNVEMFKHTMLQSKTLIEGIGAVLANISNDTANLWSLRIGIYTDIDKTQVTVTKSSNNPTQKKRISIADKIPYSIWKVVDLNYSGMASTNHYKFRTKSFVTTNTTTKTNTTNRVTSIIRSISLSSKMSNEAGLNVYFNGSTNTNSIVGDNVIHAWLYKYDLKDGESFDDDFISKPTHDQFKTALPPDAQLSTGTQAQENSARTNDIPDWPNYIKAYLPLSEYPSAWGPKNSPYVSDLSTAREIMRDAYFQNITTGVKVKAITGKFEAVVPLELEMELEGISGLRAGDIFLLDNFPSIYQNKGVFQIINLTQEVDRTTWKTKIKAHFRVQRKNDASVNVKPDAKLAPATPEELKLFSPSNILKGGKTLSPGSVRG